MHPPQKKPQSSSPVKTRFGRVEKSPMATVKTPKVGRSGTSTPKLFNRLRKSNSAAQARDENGGNTMNLDDSFKYFNRVLTEVATSEHLPDHQKLCAQKIEKNISRIQEIIDFRRKDQSDTELGSLSQSLCDDLNQIKNTYMLLKTDDLLPGNAYDISHQALDKLLQLTSPVITDALKNFVPDRTPLQKAARSRYPVSIPPNLITRALNSSIGATQPGLPEKKSVQFSKSANETRIYTPGSTLFANSDEKSGDNADSSISALDDDAVVVTVTDPEPGDWRSTSGLLKPYTRHASANISIPPYVTTSVTTSITPYVTTSVTTSITTTVTTSVTPTRSASNITPFASQVQGETRNRPAADQAPAFTDSPGSKRRAQEELNRSSPKLQKRSTTQTPAKAGPAQTAAETDVERGFLSRNAPPSPYDDSEVDSSSQHEHDEKS